MELLLNLSERHIYICIMSWTVYISVKKGFKYKAVLTYQVFKYIL